MDLTDLYSDRILEIAANPPDRPRLAAPHGSAKKVARMCGSLIEVDVVLDGDVVAAYGHKVSACALGQTSASIVAREVIGTTKAELLALGAQVEAMLKAGGAAPDGRWADLGLLAAVRDYPARHGSTLLVFEALAAAIAEAERR